jgi:hypothetical protein
MNFGAFQKQFSFHFKDVDVSKFEWVRNLCAPNVFGLTICEQEQLTDISCDGSLKDVCNDYQNLSDKSRNVFLSLEITCETLDFLLALCYELDNQGSRVRFPAGAGNFSLHHRVQNGS